MPAPTAQPEPRITSDLQILLYMHCALCLKERPANVSMKDWAKTQTGWTPAGLQVWCNRHDCNILNLDFEGQQLPAITYRSAPSPTINEVSTTTE